MYDVVQVKGQMAGGHYAAADENGNVIGADFGLDKTRAHKLAIELTKAWRKGSEEGKSRD